MIYPIPRHGSIYILLLCFAALNLIAQPDMTINRLATATDAAYWPQVNEGDFLAFIPDAANNSFYLTEKDGLVLDVGAKILIRAGNYGRIFINGSFCQNTEAQPTVITNWGGQVSWGDVQVNSQYRSLELVDFTHVHLTGKYDPVAQTGDPNFLGHNGGQDFDTGDYYEKYGLWGNQRWSGMLYGFTNPNCVRAKGFETCKVDYVAAWGGGFAGFNLKSDNPTNPERVKVNVQDNFAGFVNGEGFYIGYSTTAMGQDLVELTMRNNVIVFTGTEAIQTDNLSAGSIIENNVIVGTATTYRAPFHVFQNGAHQLSHVEGGVTVRDNVMVGGKHHMEAIRWREIEAGRAMPDPSKKLIIDNNYIGMGKLRPGFIDHSSGLTDYEITNNVFGFFTYPHTMDSEPGMDQPGAHFLISNHEGPILFSGNQFHHDAFIYEMGSGDDSLITSSGDGFGLPALLVFEDSGFPTETDWASITRWTPVYETSEMLGVYVPYEVGNVVQYFDASGETKFFQCIQAHAGDFDPNTSPAYWQQMTWNGRNMPPLDLRLQADTFYNYRGMGLTYNQPNQNTADYEPPVLNLVGGDMSILMGETFVDPGCSASDNVDGDMTDSLQISWVGAPVDTSIAGEYVIEYKLTEADSAGNVTDPVYRRVMVSAPGNAVTKTVKLNLHRNSMANLPDWTDLANDTQGLRNTGPTNTTLYDSSGANAGWSLLIDNINGGYSEHYRTHSNAVGIQIGDFPAEVTKVGLRIRNPHENPCVLVFDGMDSTRYYDVEYTGYEEGSGVELTSTLHEFTSDIADSINILGNTDEIGYLPNLITDTTGRLDLEFYTTVPDGRPNISGLIIREKSGYGSLGAHPELQPVGNISLEPNASSSPIALALSDSDSNAGELTIWVVSSDPSVVHPQDVVITGTGLARSMLVQATGAGTTTISLVVSDGYHISTIDFDVDVQSSALFEQNFDSSSIVADFFNASSPASGEFHDISTEINGGVFSIDAGALKIVRNASSGSDNDAGFTRTDDFLGNADQLHIAFDMQISDVDVVWNELFLIELGSWSGISDYDGGGSYQDLYQRLEVKGHAGENFKIKIDGQTSALLPLDTWCAFDWYINHTGQSQNYVGPDAQTYALGADQCDIWVNGVRLIVGAMQGSFSGASIDDFRVRFSSVNAVTARFDNLVIRDQF
ncbi:immunoglobulin-like domain-containing protein [Cerasicoccus frondis]|uniref:immunoglobulin-like domain-containing protein n=1 Tax=Cerasicoccus frondis TaxID=490090 RepID=UPI0028529642|nr:immunoglobulin-like domain-containing protein [Cerasicoccus frondis]